MNFFMSYIRNQDLIDVWREFNKDKRHFTWKRLRPTPIFSRLDLFLVSDLVFQATTLADILPGYKIDHSTPVLHVDSGDTRRGPGFWKFNVSLLEDKEFTSHLESILEVELAQTYKGYKTKWEMIKLAIRSHTLKYAALKKKSRDNKLEVLERKLKQVEGRLHQQTLFQEDERYLMEIQKEINEIVEYKIRGAMVRVEATWTEEGEKPTSYFLRLEKHNKNLKYNARINKRRRPQSHPQR